jgi:hypothetical protein
VERAGDACHSASDVVLLPRTGPLCLRVRQTSSPRAAYPGRGRSHHARKRAGVPGRGHDHPCWSYDDLPDWSRKHGTTGFNAQLVSLLDGSTVYVSDPLPGKTMTPQPSRKHRSRKSSNIPAAESATRVTKDAAAWPRREKNRAAVSSARRTRRGS